MNIVVFGAGAIGSLFGGLLAAQNHVTLVGRKAHVEAIQQHGLQIKGKTQRQVKMFAVETVSNIKQCPDVILLTVKAYDTEQAVQEMKPIIGKHTVVISLQNGLDNIEKITQHVDASNVIAGVTTQGALLEQPGKVRHTGNGSTMLGELHGHHTKRLTTFVELLNNAGISATATCSIHRDLWMKAIVNASINPLTAIFECQNGELKKNPLLKKFVELLCYESVQIAQSQKIYISYEKAFSATFEVISQTAQNRSSMLQSFDHHTPTEIQSITGILINKGKQQGCDVLLNTITHQTILTLEHEKIVC